MATQKVKITSGTPIVWADTTDYSSTNSGFTRTAQIDLTSLANSAARQGAAVDLGATRSQRYRVVCGFELDVAPTSAAAIGVYFAESEVSAKALPGGTSGSDAAYTGTAGDALADAINQLTRVGEFYCTSDAATVVQYQIVGQLVDPLRYVFPVVYNTAGQAFEGDAVEMFIALIPLDDDVQAAA